VVAKTIVTYFGVIWSKKIFHISTPGICEQITILVLFNVNSGLVTFLKFMYALACDILDFLSLRSLRFL